MITTDYGATLTFECDNKPNPFKSNWLQVRSAQLLQFDLPQYLTDNNITRITHAEGTTTTVVSTYMYKYNERGYPVQVEVNQEVSTPEGSFVLTPPICRITYTCK